MGGLEVLPLGFLILVTGTLIVVNAWAVIDAKMAVTAASREAARTFVEAPPGSADAEAQRAGREALSSYGRSAARLTLSHDAGGDYRRCQRVTFTASYTVPALTVPFIGGLGSGLTVRSRHSEIIDPFASRPGLTARSDCVR